MEGINVLLAKGIGDQVFREGAVAMISYRHYQPGDEERILSLWNRELPQDSITLKRLRNLILLDPNFDPQGLQLAFDGDELVGCLYAVRRLLPMYGVELEPDTGWIPVFFVARDYRRQGIGSRLMTAACRFLREQGRKQVFFASYAPNYIVPGIDAEAYPEGYRFLLQQGFEVQYSPVAMDKSLVGYEMDRDVLDLKAQREGEGYTFSQAADRDLYELIQLATKVFNPDWGRAIREGILRGLPMERILVVRHHQRVVGFCLYGGYEGVAERFGPFGVSPAEQGKGLGKILLQMCLAQMRAEGLHTAWFLWTSETSAAGHLYQRAGFTITRRFHVMRRLLG